MSKLYQQLQPTFQAIHEELDEQNERLTELEQGGSGAGIPAEVRQALYTLLSNVAFDDNATYTDELVVIEAWAEECTGITLGQSTASVVYGSPVQLTAVTEPSGCSVSWSSSDTSIATVSASGLVTGVGNGTAIITASCGDYSATCTATISGCPEVTGITATYTQSGTVYDTASLSDLTADLVVTATYDDSSTVTLTSDQYTLSGTMSVGTNTITVTYGSFTDTFTVTVADTSIYNWDFTTSLTDSVSGKTATTTATFTEGVGIVFTAQKQYVKFASVYSRDRTYEVDVVEMGSPLGTGNYRRLMAFSTNDNTLNCAYLSHIMYSGKKQGWWIYGGTGNGWSSSALYAGSENDDYGRQLFDGMTVRLYLDLYGHATVSYKPIGAPDSEYVTLGTSDVELLEPTNRHVFIGGTNADSMASATISGFRIYEGEK